jgi:hypothetical protein
MVSAALLLFALVNAAILLFANVARHQKMLLIIDPVPFLFVTMTSARSSNETTPTSTPFDNVIADVVENTHADRSRIFNQQHRPTVAISSKIDTRQETCQDYHQDCDQRYHNNKDHDRRLAKSTTKTETVVYYNKDCDLCLAQTVTVALLLQQQRL